MAVVFEAVEAGKCFKVNGKLCQAGEYDYEYKAGNLKIWNSTGSNKNNPLVNTALENCIDQATGLAFANESELNIWLTANFFRKASASGGGGGPVDWNTEVYNKPVLFPPEDHTHDTSEIISGIFTASRLGAGAATDGYVLTSNMGSPEWKPALSFTGNYWSTTGNTSLSPTTNFLGNIDNVPLSFRVNNNQVAKFDGSNVIIGNSGTVASGNSTALGRLAIATGDENLALGSRTSATGTLTAIAIGGYETKANQNYAIAIGKLSAAIHPGAFVMHDNQPEAYYPSDATGQFKVKFSGGFNFQINSGSAPITTFLISPTGLLSSFNMPVYSDNAAALAGGAPLYSFFRATNGQLCQVF